MREHVRARISRRYPRRRVTIARARIGKNVMSINETNGSILRYSRVLIEKVTLDRLAMSHAIRFAFLCQMKTR